MSILLYINLIVTYSFSIIYKNDGQGFPPASSFWKGQYSFRERPMCLKLEAESTPEGPERRQKHDATILGAC